MAPAIPHRDCYPAHPAAGEASSIQNALVGEAYARLTPVYDFVFGAVLQAGRVAAIERMVIRPGDRVLEVGVGTGINTPLYPHDCRVTAIDLSAPMLERARERVTRLGLAHVQLLEQDAAQMGFADDAFDAVYAPYVISVVPEPLTVVRQMRRVCRRGGRIVILNHFRTTAAPVVSWLERLVSPLTAHLGFRLDLELPGLLREAKLRPLSIERVNVPPAWTLVTCTKD
jgi:phosphatidylethanolamine/phosphatidyl-N-methylethanolamine N-methyltransferase